MDISKDRNARVRRPWSLVEADHLDPLHPRGVLTTQVLVELQQRPPFQDLRRRNITLRQPTGGQQLTQEFRVGLIGLGPPLRPTQHRRVRRLGQMRRHADLGHLLGHVPPARAGPWSSVQPPKGPGVPGRARPRRPPLHRERRPRAEVVDAISRKVLPSPWSSWPGDVSAAMAPLTKCTCGAPLLCPGVSRQSDPSLG
jgi:hypothetical protein